MDANEVSALARSHWRVAIRLSVAVFTLYFGFIGLVAFAKETMALQIVPGLSLGIVLGAGVIVGAWLSTWIYVMWTNSFYDAKVISGNDR